MIIGRNGLIGTDSWSPTRPLPQPHWNTATTAPYAAPIDSKFMMAALSGTSSERKTTISSRNDRAMTAAMNSGSRELSRSLMSMDAAVCPVT